MARNMTVQLTTMLLRLWYSLQRLYNRFLVQKICRVNFIQWPLKVMFFLGCHASWIIRIIIIIIIIFI